MRARLSVLVVLGLVTLLGAVLAVLSLPAQAAPGAQAFALPTPTLYPTENTPYTLSVVGGEDLTLTFSYADQGAFTLGEATVRSQYPRGMIFTLKPTSANGPIDEVILFYRFVHDSGSRAAAEWDPAAGQWVAHIWATGEQRPAFMHLNFKWRVRDVTGAYVDTAENPVDYWDPNRQWFRMESEDVILYWFGFSADDPDYVASRMADRMAAATQRLIVGFGRRLSYKPTAVVYPDRESFAEITASGIANNRVAGFTSSDLGVSIQVLRDTGLVPGAEKCIWSAPEEYWTMENRIATVFSTTPHEVTHLYQYDVIGFPPGFEWVSEGQAEFFANNFRNGEERLAHLATLQDLPTLQINIGSDLPTADGCTALSYVVGPAFWNWINLNYGGMETIAAIIRLQRAQKSIYEAVETVTGRPFLEIENEWRAHYGFRTLTPADIDPALALQPYEDSLLAVGDVITLPAMPALVPLAENPGPRSLASGQCFGNMSVTIKAMGTLDEVPYFQIDCMGMVGWVTRDKLVAGQ